MVWCRKYPQKRSTNTSKLYLKRVLEWMYSWVYRLVRRRSVASCVDVLRVQMFGPDAPHVHWPRHRLSPSLQQLRHRGLVLYSFTSYCTNATLQGRWRRRRGYCLWRCCHVKQSPAHLWQIRKHNGKLCSCGFCLCNCSTQCDHRTLWKLLRRQAPPHPPPFVSNGHKRHF